MSPKLFGVILLSKNNFKLQIIANYINFNCFIFFPPQVHFIKGIDPCATNQPQCNKGELI